VFGILTGLRATMRHILNPSSQVTRKYPYERRELPERSRGLIALLLEPETNIFRCESCLMCEKACPPRAISISYRFRDGFRRRPPIAPRAAYYRIRMVAAAPYGERRPLSTAVITVPEEEDLAGFDGSLVERILRATPEGEDRLVQVLRKTCDAYGYFPWAAGRVIAEEFSLAMTDLYTAGSMLPNFRGAPQGKGTAVPRGERMYTGNLGIAGEWPAVSPPPAHEEAHAGVDELALAHARH
jgi:ferredoxin